MKKIALILILTLIIPAIITAGNDDLNWTTRLDEARKLAADENKTILLFFTGSDWCGWCKKLVAQVLSKPEFKEFADTDLVLVKLDFPKSIPMENEQKEYNSSLAKEYKIQGFPTIILLNAKGEVLGQTGYQDLTPQAYVQHLKAFIK